MSYCEKQIIIIERFREIKEQCSEYSGADWSNTATITEMLKVA
jgi:hypothetical protein